MPFRIYSAESRSILSKTSGFIAQAGFTHSLTPARNCTYGCSYCYVPTMNVFGGLRREDWEHWGHFTTFKSNAADLLRRSIRGDEVIYCSPLVDPWQPAEREQRMMPAILDALIERPPRVFVIQTRGPSIILDIERIAELAARTVLRVSFSITTDREEIRRIYEPLCEPISERLEAVRTLTEAGIQTFATFAPLLPCNPENLVEQAVRVTKGNFIGDPFHIRELKRSGASTREPAFRIAEHHGHTEWFDADFQTTIVERIRQAAALHGRAFETGPKGFSWLSQISSFAMKP